MWHENDNFKRCLRSLTTESGSQSAKVHCKSGTACRLCSPKTQLYHKHFQKTECQKKNQTAIVTNPIEECNLVPSKRCVHVAKMVPKLRVTTMCVDVPREVCTKSQIKPKKVKKPSIKKWCYTPDAHNEITNDNIITTTTLFSKLKNIVSRLRDFLLSVFYHHLRC